MRGCYQSVCLWIANSYSIADRQRSFPLNSNSERDIFTALLHRCDFPKHWKFGKISQTGNGNSINRDGVSLLGQLFNKAGIIDAGDGALQHDIEPACFFVEGDRAAGNIAICADNFIDDVIRFFDCLSCSLRFFRELLKSDVNLRRRRTLRKRNSRRNAHRIRIIPGGNKAGFLHFIKAGINANVRSVIFTFRSRPHNQQIVKACIVNDRRNDVDAHSGNLVIVFAHSCFSSFISALVK